MNQARALHAFGERNHVLRADNIRAQSAFQSRIESDVAGGVDYHIDVISNSLRVLFTEAEIVFGDVTADDSNSVTNETIQRFAVTLAQRIEWRRRNDVIPEARFGFF